MSACGSVWCRTGSQNNTPTTSITVNSPLILCHRRTQQTSFTGGGLMSTPKVLQGRLSFGFTLQALTRVNKHTVRAFSSSSHLIVLCTCSISLVSELCSGSQAVNDNSIGHVCSLLLSVFSQTKC